MNYFTKLKFIFLLVFAYSLQTNGQYCMPSADCTYADGVLEFSIGDFSNVSTCSADNDIPGYGDFTALTGMELGQGTPYFATLLSGFSSQQMSIWIDSNNDMAFDSTELILADEPVGTDPVVAEVVIPNLALGTYIMRVQSAYNQASSPDACVMPTYGETEDYTVTIVAPPSCPAPSGLTATAITSNSAMAIWTENGTATAWDIEIVEAGNTATGMPSAGYDDITNPVMISGLTPITGYEIFVRADCGMDNSNVSTWSALAAFTTDCAEYIPTYSEDFTVTDPATDMAACWEEADAGTPATGPSEFGSGRWFDSGFANDGTFTGAMRVNLYQGEVVSDWLISPTFNLTTGGPYQVEFDFSISAWNTADSANLGSDDRISFLISADGGASWTNLQTWSSVDDVNPLGEKMIYDLSAYGESSVSFAFWASDGVVDDPEDNDIYVDNFFVRTPPTCVETSGLGVGTIGATSAVVSWEENGSATTWDIEFDTTGFMPTGMPTTGYDDVTANPTTITGLTPENTYDVYVRADCDMDNGSNVAIWQGPFTFTAACAEFAPPYEEAFTDLPFGALANCWSEADAGDLTTGPMDFGSGTWTTDDFGNVTGDGAMKINLYQGGVRSDWLISPTFDLSTGGPYQVEFDFSIVAWNTTNATNLGSDDQVVFLVTSDMGATWTTLQTWTAANNVNPAGEKIIHDLAGYTGMSVQFAFYGSDGTVDDAADNDIFVDDFFVRQPPSCAEVSGITAENITESSVDISWVENGTATVWDIEFDTTGFMPTGTPTMSYDNVGSNPTTITGLDANTSYDVYVRADCGMDNMTDASIWIGPITFRTDCGIFSVPYSNDFSDVFNDPCWMEASDGDPTTGPMSFGGGGWTSDDFGNIADDASAKINLYNVGDSSWLISPTFDLSGAIYSAEFDFSIVAWNTTNAANLGSDDEVKFLISTDNMATWTTLSSWDATSNVDPMGEHVVVDLTPYLGNNVIFAFWGAEGATDDPEDNDIFVDNFEISFTSALPLVVSSSSTNATCNGSSDGAIDLMASGGTAPLMYLWSNTETTEDLTGLAAGDYTVTVTDADGATLTEMVTITEPEAVEGTTSVVDETLDGAADGSIDLTVGGGGVAPYTFLWDNQETTEDLAGLDDGTYCVTITDANGCTTSTCADIMAGPLSLSKIEDLTSFRIYPNPVADENVWLDLSFSSSKNLEISWINAFGQEVYQANHWNVSELRTEISAADLPAGIYFVRVISLDENTMITRRLVKQ